MNIPDCNFSPEQIFRALDCCSKITSSCHVCPFHGSGDRLMSCTDRLFIETRKLVLHFPEKDLSLRGGEEDGLHT